MDLHEGRVKQMVRDATKKESTIICHSTLEGEQAGCRGFFENHPTLPLILARAFGKLRFVEIKKK